MVKSPIKREGSKGKSKPKREGSKGSKPKREGSRVTHYTQKICSFLNNLCKFVE